MRLHARAWLALILVVYLLLTFGYGAVNPLFEAPDEHWHYFTAQYIAETGKLPFVAAEYDEWLSQEAAQPPLYYLLGALLIAPVDTAGAREQVWFNPHAAVGDASVTTNVNRFVHTPAEAWPWRGYALAAHLLRGFSTLLGLGTLLCLYGSGRLLWPTKAPNALLTTALVAFLPQFNFIHGSVSNDPLITFLAAAALWQILRLWLLGLTRRRLLLLGMSIGLAALAKNAGVLLLAYALGVLFLLVIRDATQLPDQPLRLMVKRLAGAAALVILPVLLIAGWLWWRNWILYHDFTAANQFVRIANGDRGYTLLQVLGESSGLWTSLFAVFGWFNLRAPAWVYHLWNGLVLLALVGFIISLPHLYRGSGFVGERATPLARRSPADWLQQQWVPALLLATWAFVVYVGLAAFMMRTEAAQGRLLFPAIVPLALGLAWGLSRLPWRGFYWLAPLLALTTTLYCLFAVVASAYARPAVLAQLPSGVMPITTEMGQGLQLLGATIEATTVQPGEMLWFTLYWRADEVPAQAPEFKLEVFGRDLERDPIGALHSYHGRGLYPANLWPTGAIVADRFAVQIEATAAAPVLARVFVRLSDAETGAEAGAVKVIPARWPAAEERVLAQVGENILLTSASVNSKTAEPGQNIELDLTWRVTAAPGTHFTTLVHLAHAGQPPLATGDRPPLDGTYPTHVWAAGEVIEDRYTLRLPLDLPDGRYPLWIGMYDSATISRLPLTVEGVRQPDDVYLVAWIEVRR